MTVVGSTPTVPIPKTILDDVTNSTTQSQSRNDVVTTMELFNPLDSPAPETDDDDVTNSDTQSRSSNDDVNDVQCYNPLEAMVQNLGYPGSDSVPPQFKQVSIDNSSDVHFGDKNFYHGPVNIKQIVYANAAPLATNGDINNKLGCKDNLGYEATDGGDQGCPKSGAGDVDLPVPRKGVLWFLSKHKTLELGFFLGVLMLFLVVLTTVLLLKHPATTNSPSPYDTSEQDNLKPLDFDTEITVESQLKNKLRIVSRIEWVAQPPINDTTPLVTPVPYVIIHHTATDFCYSIAQCALHVRLIQTFHIDSRGFYDIGYNFLVGGDGAAYEGRGWTIEGAHALGYNSRSIGIAFIGTFISKMPPEIQILAAQKLIQKGVQLGYIKKDYKLLGARQLAGTESPGSALYEDIKTWPHWAEKP